MVGDEQSAQTSQKTDADRQPDDFLEAVSEQVGDHLRDGEQRDGQHDTYHTKAGNDGQRNKHHQQIFEYLYRDLLRTGKLPVESDIYDWTDEQIENPVNSRANMPSIQRSV